MKPLAELNCPTDRLRLGRFELQRRFDAHASWGKINGGGVPKLPRVNAREGH